MKQSERDTLLIRIDERTKNTVEAVQKLVILNGKQDTAILENCQAIRENRKDYDSDKRMARILAWVVGIILLGSGGAAFASPKFVAIVKLLIGG